MAPGMGQNAFVTYGIVLGLGHSWPTALGAVFVSGVIFVLLSVLPVREWLINAIPRNLKLGIASGIGFFLGFIALRNAGIVIDNPATLVSFGDLTEFAPVVCLLAFAVIAALSARKITGAVIIGVLGAAALGWIFGASEFKGIVSVPPSVAPVMLQLDIRAALELSMITVILTLLLVDVFDTAGTIVGVANRANLMTADGKMPRLGMALLSGSGATVVGAVVGTSSTTSSIDRAAGVEAGGRPGLTAGPTGPLCRICLFFAPLAQSVPAYASAAALLFVACIMVRSLADIDWEDYTECTPAVVCALAMPLSFSIADGIGLGFVTYATVKVLAGKPGECPAAVYVLALIFAGKFAFL